MPDETQKRTLRVPANIAAQIATGSELAIDALDREIRELELETARITLKRTRKENQDYEQGELTKEERFRRAQRTLAKQVEGQENLKAGCNHQQGGFGLEDLYQGNGPSSLSVTELPIKGRVYILCTRCLGEWRTPDPLLKKTDPEIYREQAAAFKEILKLVRNSMARTIGVPTFNFETEEGVPVHPVSL